MRYKPKSANGLKIKRTSKSWLQRGAFGTSKYILKPLEEKKEEKSLDDTPNG